MEALRSRMAVSVALRARCHNAMMIMLSTLISMHSASTPVSRSILIPQLDTLGSLMRPGEAGHMGMVAAVGSQLIQAVQALEEPLLNSGPTFIDTAQTAAAANPMAKAVIMNRKECLGLPYTSTEYRMMSA